MKVALVQGVLAHYRQALFTRLDGSDGVDFTFFSDGHDVEGIAALPPGAVWRHRTTRTYRVGPIRWQRGIVSLAFSSEFDALILMGDPHYLSSWVAAAVARGRGLPVLFWAHGWRREERGARRLVRLAFFRLTDRLLIYSERGKRLGVRAGYPADRMTVVYNSLDLDRADAIVSAIERGPVAMPAPATLFDDAGRPLVICTARLTQVSRFDLLLRAASILQERGRPLNILLVGDGPMRGGLEALARELDLAVRFAGAVYDEERLGQWLYHADLTVSPGKVGLTAIHSLMYGTPVVTHGNLDRQMPEAETVVPGETGALFEEGDAVDLADTIAHWLDHKRDRAVVRKRCRDLVRQAWSPQRQAHLMVEAVLSAVRAASSRK